MLNNIFYKNSNLFEKNLNGFQRSNLKNYIYFNSEHLYSSEICIK